jgi:hypothetical protein
VLLGASNEASVASNLKAYVIITIFGIVAGVVFGYFFDIVGFRAKSENIQQNNNEDLNLSKTKNTSVSIFVQKLGFYAILVMAIFLAPGSIMALWGDEIEAISSLTNWISIALTITCIIFYYINKFTFKDHDCYSSYSNVKSTILHAILDVAMVVTYVFIGLFVANYVIDVLVGADTFDSWMRSSVHLVILIAALIGVTPGCGGVIAVAVAFITIPNFPMAALIAAAISTSGDGIFPLLAENKKDGFIVSLLGLVIALVVGYLALVIGF